MTGVALLSLQWSDYEELLSNEINETNGINQVHEMDEVIETNNKDNKSFTRWNNNDIYNLICHLYKIFYFPNTLLMKVLTNYKQNDFWKMKNRLYIGKRMRLICRAFDPKLKKYIVLPNEFTLCYDFCLISPFIDQISLLNILIKVGIHKNDFEWLMENHPKLSINNQQVNPFGNTPLHTAAKFRRCDIIYILFKHGGQMLLKNKRGQTVFDVAIESQKNIKSCFNAL